MNSTKVQATKNSSIVVKCEFISAPLIRVKANKNMLLTSTDGSKSVMIEPGNIFYLAKADSIGDGYYYVITFDIHTATGTRCFCPAYSTCKHARAASDHNINYHRTIKALKYDDAVPVAVKPARAGSVQELQPAHAASVPAVQKLPISSKITTGSPLPTAPAVKGNLNGNRGFSVMATSRR